MRRRFVSLIAAAAMAMGASIFVDTPAGAQASGVDHQVVVIGFQYIPQGSGPYGAGPSAAGAGFPVMLGDTITFTQFDVPTHSATSCNNCGLSTGGMTASGDFDTGLIPLAGSKTINTLDLPRTGTFTYYCKFNHPTMRGSFTVIDPAAPLY